MNRRHSKTFALRSELWDATEVVAQRFTNFQKRIESLKTIICCYNTGVLNVVKAAQSLIMPQRLILPILEEFREPSHEEFSGPNLWSLHNAFTEVYRREFKPTVLWERTEELGKFFKM